MNRRLVRAIPAAALFAVVSYGCAAETEDNTQASMEKLREESCAVAAPTACPEQAPGFQDVLPIFEASCNTCHDPSDPLGPWPLHDYEHVVLWRSEVRDEVLSCSMPPKDGEPLTPEDRLLLMQWIFCGMPE